MVRLNVAILDVEVDAPSGKERSDDGLAGAGEEVVAVRVGLTEPSNEVWHYQASLVSEGGSAKVTETSLVARHPPR